MRILETRTPLRSAILRGGLAGVGATLAMSAVMLGARRLGLSPTLPPERIAQASARATRTPEHEQLIDGAAAVAHLGFGAAGGAVYGGLARAIGGGPLALVGIGWGLVIWAGSYFGWIPALGILPPPHADHPGRAWTMFLAHLVYGASLAALWRAGSGGRPR